MKTYDKKELNFAELFTQNIGSECETRDDWIPYPKNAFHSFTDLCSIKDSCSI